MVPRYLYHFVCLVVFLLVGACDRGEQPLPARESADLSAALSRFTEDVRIAERELLQSKFYVDEAARAEAYRYLSGMMAVQLRDALHFNSDPAFPTFHRVVAIGNKWGFSNPDNLYLAATVSEDYGYRISGRLGTANHTIFGSYAGDDEDGRAGERVLGRDLRTADDGSFELIVSKRRPPEAVNWIELVEKATSITIYQVFGDWENEGKGAYRIEAIGRAGEAPAHLNEELVGRQLTTAGNIVRSRVQDWLSIAERIDRLPDNRFMPPRQIQIASLGSWFQYGNYKVEDDEALIIEVESPVGARYWGLTLYNWWGETLDYRNRQTSLNHSQATIDQDGMLRVVLSARDPGVNNWLDISEHPRGPINWRVNSPSEPQRFSSRLVPFEALRKLLPPETPILSPAERKDAIAARQRQVDKRYSE